MNHVARTVNVASDFSRSPVGRYREDGPFSGQTFREKFLVPTLRTGGRVIIEMDGTRGYGSSFLEEAFGGLRRLGFDPADLANRIAIVTKDPSLKMEILRYLRGN